jgi:hypothetical protein
MDYQMVDADWNPPEFEFQWDEEDPVACVLGNLVRIQNKIQSMYNAGQHGPFPPDEQFDEAFAHRDQLIDEL